MSKDMTNTASAGKPTPTDTALVRQAPSLIRFLSDVQAAPVDPATRRDRSRGVLLGLAVGNVLGLQGEGRWSSEIPDCFLGGVIEPDSDEKHRPMDDDLAQAVELGEALRAGDDAVRDLAQRLVTWRHENARGIGNTTKIVVGLLEILELLEKGTPPSEVARVFYKREYHRSFYEHESPFPNLLTVLLELLEKGTPPEAARFLPARVFYERNPIAPNSIAPNGGLMRCAPVAVAHHSAPEALVRDSAALCAVTHYAPACQWSCIVINAAIALLLRGTDPDLPALLAAAAADGAPDMLAAASRDGIPTEVLASIASGQPIVADNSWLLQNHGLIAHTLLAMQVGLWAVATPLDFEAALVQIVSAGGDTDTNGAVTGAVLGARYGAAAIPPQWLDCIPERERIEALADDLAALSIS